MRTCVTLVFLGLLSLIQFGCEVQKSGHSLTQSPPDAEHVTEFLELAKLKLPSSAQPIKFVEEQTDEKKTMWLSIKIDPKEFKSLNGPDSPFKGLGFRVDELPPDDPQIKDFYCLSSTLPEKLNVVSTGFDGKRSLTMFHVEGANPNETWFVYFRVKNK
jgi:hypothetical protein